MSFLTLHCTGLLIEDDHTMTDSVPQLLSRLFQAHPWHGVDPGDIANGLAAYLEILPTDTVKLELDKPSGILRIDRPQRFSNVCPMPYGFVPQTFCAEKIAALCMNAVGRVGIVGDGDPLDICVLTERTLTRADLLVRCVPIGGLRMIDKNEADDKIIAVLEGDVAFGHFRDISQCPAGLIDRLRHYFLTYKQLPGGEPRTVEITDVYGAQQAVAVIEASRLDYAAHYGDPAQRWAALLALLRG